MGTHTQLSVPPWDRLIPLFRPTRSRLPEPLPGEERAAAAAGERLHLAAAGPSRAGIAPAAPPGLDGPAAAAIAPLGTGVFLCLPWNMPVL